MELKKLNKRGVAGFDLATGAVYGLIFLIILSLIAIVIIYSVMNANILPAGSEGQNTSLDIARNGSAGIRTLMQAMPTVFGVVVVVMLMLLLVLVLVTLKRVKDTNGGGNDF